MKKQFLKLWYWLFPKAKVAAVNHQLNKALKNKAKERINLLVEIKNYIIKELKIDKKSKYIPLHVRRTACTQVNVKFGERMRFHKIRININLELVAA